MMQPDDVYQPDLSQLEIKDPVNDVTRPAVVESSQPAPLFDGSPFAPQAAQASPPPAGMYSGGSGGVIDLSSRPQEGGIDLSVPYSGAAQVQRDREREEQEHSFVGQAHAVLRESGVHAYLPAQVQEVLGIDEEEQSRPQSYGPDAIHQRAAERACEGRWVPTYMRQQLIENGHTEIPKQPNAHEFKSGEGPPPSLFEAIKGMGEEISNILYAALGGIVDLTAQCKRAAHKAIESSQYIGDGVVIETCDEICFGVCGSQATKPDQTDLTLEAVPPVIPETTPTLGPIRSRLRRELPCSFEALVLIAKTQLLTPHAPPELQRLMKRREFLRQTTDHKSASERWHLLIEPGADATPRVETFPQLNPGVSCPQLREIWHVYPKHFRASVEISNEPSWAAKVLVCLKMDIVQLPDGANCEIDSRLYMLPRDRDPDRQEADLPKDLIEALIDAHHVQTERVRDLMLAMLATHNRSHRTSVAPEIPEAPEAPAMNLPGMPSHPSQDLLMSPHPVDQKMPPGSARRSRGTAFPVSMEEKTKNGESNSGVDNDLLLKMADGI